MNIVDITYVVLIILVFLVLYLLYNEWSIKKNLMNVDNSLLSQINQTSTNLTNQVNALNNSLSTQVNTVNTNLSNSIAAHRTPIFLGTRPLIFLPSTGLKYTSTPTLISSNAPDGEILQPFGMYLGTSNWVPYIPSDYVRKFRFYINYTDNVMCGGSYSNYDCSKGSIFELCFCDGATTDCVWANTMACPSDNTELTYDLPVTWAGGLTSPRDWYSNFIDPTNINGKNVTTQHARPLIQINPAAPNISTCVGILYSVSVECWAMPS